MYKLVTHWQWMHLEMKMHAVSTLLVVLLTVVSADIDHDNFGHYAIHVHSPSDETSPESGELYDRQERSYAHGTAEDIPRTSPNSNISECEVVQRDDQGCPPLFPCINGRCKITVKDDNIFSLTPVRELYCECDPGWNGYECEKCCPLRCGNNGTCKLDGITGRPICACDWGYDGEFCEKLIKKTDWRVYMSLIGLFVLAIGVFSVLMIYYMWKQRKVIPVKLSQAVNKLEENNFDCSYKYDAFISYRSSKEDEHFVIHQLLPKLEKDMGLTVCLHQRDFEIGESV